MATHRKEAQPSFSAPGLPARIPVRLPPPRLQVRKQIPEAEQRRRTRQRSYAPAYTRVEGRQHANAANARRGTWRHARQGPSRLAVRHSTARKERNPQKAQAGEMNDGSRRETVRERTPAMFRTSTSQAAEKQRPPPSRRPSRGMREAGARCVRVQAQCSKQQPERQR